MERSNTTGNRADKHGDLPKSSTLSSSSLSEHKDRRFPLRLPFWSHHLRVNSSAWSSPLLLFYMITIIVSSLAVTLSSRLHFCLDFTKGRTSSQRAFHVKNNSPISVHNPFPFFSYSLLKALLGERVNLHKSYYFFHIEDVVRVAYTILHGARKTNICLEYRIVHYSKLQA